MRRLYLWAIAIAALAFIAGFCLMLAGCTAPPQKPALAARQAKAAVLTATNAALMKLATPPQARVAAFHAQAMAASVVPVPTNYCVTVSWGKAEDTHVVGYFVLYGPSSRNYTNSVDEGNTTNATVCGLVSGFDYFFCVVAYDKYGLQGDYSNQRAYETGVVVPPVTNYETIVAFPVSQPTNRVTLLMETNPPPHWARGLMNGTSLALRLNTNSVSGPYATVATVTVAFKPPFALSITDSIR
jgi:fibronectin type III domain protein